MITGACCAGAFLAAGAVAVHGGPAGSIAQHSTPTSTTFAGQLIVYVLFPLIVAAVLGGAAAVSRFHRRLSTFEQGLALVVQQVSPPGAPALRELVHGQAVEFANLKGQVAMHLAVNEAANKKGNT